MDSSKPPQLLKTTTLDASPSTTKRKRSFLHTATCGYQRNYFSKECALSYLFKQMFLKDLNFNY